MKVHGSILFHVIRQQVMLLPKFTSLYRGVVRTRQVWDGPHCFSCDCQRMMVRGVVDMLCHLPDMVRAGTCTGRQEGVLKHKLGTIKTTINETCLLQAKKENQYFFLLFLRPIRPNLNLFKI